MAAELPVWKTTAGSNGRSAPDAGTRSAGNETERNGNASTAAAAAVHTRCRNAADRPRSAQAANHAAPSTTVLLSAALAKKENHCDTFQIDIYLPSRLASSIISDIRSSSSRVRRVAETSSSAATIWSGSPAKKVSSRCFTADRLAFSRATVGAYTYF